MGLKKLIRCGLRYLRSSDYRFIIYSDYFGFGASIPDEAFIRRKFKAKMGYELNLENPVTFNEKLQWLKLNNRRPEYSRFADKYRVRDYVAEKIGKDYLVPLIGVWDDPDEIDFDALPDRFALKCNHNSGIGTCICHDKSKLDLKYVKKRLRYGLSKNYFYRSREWPYRDIPRKIIAEELLDDPSGDLKDYKMMCFNGEMKCCLLCFERNEIGARKTFFDRQWNIMPFNRKNGDWTNDTPIPPRYDEMIKMAETLAEGFPFIRVDFYNIEGRIYFGEMTFFPNGGFEGFVPKEWDEKLGSWLTLPEKYEG